MSTTLTVVSLVIGLAGVAAATGAWLAAVGSRRAAEAMTRLEADRWHAELTPQIRATCRTPTGTDRATLEVALVGPPGLDRLDQITLRVRDDNQDRTSRIAGGPTDEQIAAHVWGPYRFVPTIDGADVNGRQVEPFALELGDSQPFALERTRPPSWSGNGDPSWWGRQYDDHPVRLTFQCVRAGHRPWTVPIDVYKDDAE